MMRNKYTVMLGMLSLISANVISQVSWEQAARDRTVTGSRHFSC